MIQNGYKIPFISTPSSVFLRNNKYAFSHADFVSQAIDDLLFSGVVVEQSEPPFVVNPLTVSVNRNGKKRLVLDLRHVNLHVYKQKVKFEDLNCLKNFLKKGGFLINFDLKSGYHHLDIFEPHQKYLGFL